MRIIDNPISDATQDLLDRDDVAASVADNIRYVDASSGYVVGILGPWGSGKTSLVNLVRQKLRDKPELAILDFNPWMFAGAEQLVDSFFNELAAQLRLKGGKFERIADDFDAYSELLSPLAALPFVGAWLERVRGASSALKQFRDRRKQGVGARRARLSEELGKLDEPIVVVLDDIDRLTTTEIREIFKLVRLTASFPNIVYLLAFDRGRVEMALSEQGIEGRDYLEKIVQTVIDIPAVPRDLLLRALGVTLNEVVDAASPTQRFDEGRWLDVLFEIIWPAVMNMRDVRRLGASVFATVRDLQDQVELVDVLSLETIRVFMPDTFTAIARGRDGLTATSDIGLGRRSDMSAEKAQVEAVLAAATREAGPATGKAIIERLFPAGQQHIGGSHFGSDWQKPWLRGRRVAHKDVLQRYLERTVSDNLAAFREAELAMAVAANEAELSAHLRTIEPERLEKVITSFEIYEGEYPVEAVVPMSTALLNIVPAIPERPRGMFDLMDPSLVVARVVLRLLRQLPGKDEVRRAVDQILPNVAPLSSRAELVRLVSHQEGAGHGLVDEDVAKAYEQALAGQVEAAGASRLSTEGDLLRLWLSAERTLGRPPLEPAAITPELTMALLKSAYSETRSQGWGTRAVRRSPRLAWDVLIRIWGSEDALREAIERAREVDPQIEGHADLLELADRYLSGWRPESTRDDGD